MSRRIRTYLPVAILMAVLFAGYAYANRDEDPGAADTVTATATIAVANTPTPGASPSNTQAAETATATAPAGTPTNTPVPVARRDLQADEDAGGHTIERHISKTDAELSARLDRERNIPAASTFYDLETAEIAVAFALERNRTGVQDWESGSGNRANLALRATAEEPVGRSWERGDDEAVDVRGIVVVLAWDTRANEWFVLTSYPEAE